MLQFLMSYWNLILVLKSEIVHLVLKKLDIGEQNTGQGRTVCSIPQSVVAPSMFSSVFLFTSRERSHVPSVLHSVSDGHIGSVDKTLSNW